MSCLKALAPSQTMFVDAVEDDSEEDPIVADAPNVLPGEPGFWLAEEYMDDEFIEDLCSDPTGVTSYVIPSIWTCVGKFVSLEGSSSAMA